MKKCEIQTMHGEDSSGNGGRRLFLLILALPLILSAENASAQLSVDPLSVHFGLRVTDAGPTAGTTVTLPHTATCCKRTKTLVVALTGPDPGAFALPSVSGKR